MLRLGLLCLVLTLGSTFDLLGQDMIDYINKHENMTWTAGRNFAVSSNFLALPCPQTPALCLGPGPKPWGLTVAASAPDGDVYPIPCFMCIF